MKEEIVVIVVALCGNVFSMYDFIEEISIKAQQDRGVSQIDPFTMFLRVDSCS